jgi:PAS domain S-box-containing protein
MEERDNELAKLERLAESFTNMGNFTQIMRDSYSKLESKYEDVNSRLERVNELLRRSLAERNRLANYLSNILESLNSGVIVTDRIGIINIFNSAAEKYTGVAAERALGKNCSEVIGSMLIGDASDFFSPHKENITGEIIFHSEKGDSPPIAYSISKLQKRHTEDQAGMVVILYDLTDVRALEDSLKRVSTLAALGEMAATVAHEIRNPLAGIAGFTALLLRDLDSGSESRRLAEKIKGGVANLNAIVENLLDYTRSVTIERAEVDPRTVVEEAIRDLHMGGESIAHSIQIESSARSLKAKLDPQLYGMIVSNLVKNAIQSTPNGGDVHIKLTNSISGDLVLSVEDEGPGIASQAFDKIFTPFFTTKANGTGLGLATVKKLTELHGGRVSAMNRPEGGAVFRVEIPDFSQGEHREA